MKFKCEIELDNDAFVGYGYIREQHGELSKVIKKIAKEVDEFVTTERTKTVWDSNGNRVGAWAITNTDRADVR